MKHILYIGFLIFFFQDANAQSQNSKYWIFFNDKCESTQTDFDPHNYFSKASIDRRTRQNISFDSKDMPVCPMYKNELMDLGFKISQESRWLNAVSISSSVNQLNALIADDPEWLKSIQRVKKILTKNLVDEPSENAEKLESGPENLYGLSFDQIHIHRGDVLHEQGFRGENMIIALMDGGYFMADSLPAFTHVFDEGRFLGGYDFVDDTSHVFSSSTHGTKVWGCMAGNIDSEYLGTAPDASYYLFITEDVGSESLIEEDNWVAAGEFADSVGVHVMNTSLGYSTFDDSLENHVYADLDGNTTPISIAADVAASRGILVFNSAGNSGGSAWQYITAPADADSCIAVAAVNTAGIRASFSSKGPSADGQIKPDMASHGQSTYVVQVDSTVSPSNGTSFASPILAGLGACLWQAFPTMNNMEIRDLMYKASHQYQSPDTLLGYGIPDIMLAYESIIFGFPTSIEEEQLADNSIYVYDKMLYIKTLDTPIEYIEVRDIDGKTLEKVDNSEADMSSNSGIYLNSLQKNVSTILFVSIYYSDGVQTIKISP